MTSTYGALGGNTDPNNATIATFNGTAGTVTVGSGNTINVNTITVGTTGYIFSSADATGIINLEGTTPTINGTGTTTFTNKFTGTGGFTLAGGSFNVFAGDLTGLTGTINVMGRATLQGYAYAATGVGASVLTGSQFQTWNVTNTLTSNNRGQGATIQLGALTGNGTIRSGNDGSGAAASGTDIFQVGALNTSTTYSGTFIDQSTANITGLTKVGTGTLTLTGTSTNTGGTIVNGGTLLLGAGGGSGALRGVVTVNSGATLTLGINNALGYGTGTSVSTLNINGGTVNVNGSYGDEGFITAFNLTGGTLAYATGGSYQINAADTTAPGITSNASPTTSLISGGIGIRGGNLLYTVASGTTTSGIDLLDSGVIAGNGFGITKTGAGLLALTGANTYSAGTTITAGTLAGTTTSLLRAITDNAALVFDQTLPSNALVGGTSIASGTYAGVISGTGKVSKNNAGTVILSGANTYSGATSVNGGVLYVNGSLNAASAISVAGGARLGGIGTAGTATVASGGNIEGGQSNAGKLTLSGLTFNGTGTAFFGNLSNYTASPAIAAGALTANGGANSVTLTINGSIPGTGLYQLISYTGGSIGGTGNSAFTLATLPNRATGNLVFTNTGLIDLNVTGSDFLVWTGTTNTSWDTTNPNFKLNSNGAAATYIDSPADTVVFDDTAGAAHTTVSLNVADVHPTSVTFNNNTLNYLVQGTNAIAGTTGLTKSGTGTVTLANANTYTGLTTINAGTLQVGNGGTTGSLAATSTITDNGNLVFNRTDTVTQGTQFSTVAITGTGSLTQAGTGNLILNAAETYTGGTTVNAGTLTLNAGGGSGNVQGAIAVNAGATLNLAAGDALGYNAGASVTAVNVNGGTVTSGTNNEGYLTNFNLTGGTVAAGALYRFNVNAATPPGIASLASATGSTFAANIDDYPGSSTAANLGINVASGVTADGTDLTISGIIRNSGGTAGLAGITKTGSGTLSLTGNNTFTGPTNVNAGTLAIGGATGGLYTNGTVAGAVNVASGATLRFDRNDGLGGSGVTSPVIVTVNGGTLASNNTYTSLSNPVLNGATVTVNGGSNAGFPGFSLRGMVTVGGTAVTNINAGTTGNTFNNVAIGTYYGSAATTGDAVTFNVADVTSSSAVDLNVNTFLTDQTTAGGNSLVKIGAGTMALNGVNTYTGATTVNAGTLLVNGSTAAASAVTVGSNVAMGPNTMGTLGGTGTISGATTINPNSTITGADVGTVGALTLQSTLTINGTYAVDISADGATADKLTISGALALNSANITFTGTPTAASYVLATFASETGNFVGTAPSGYAFQFNSNGMELDLVAVPEPATWIAGLLVVGLLGVSRRRQIGAWLELVRR